MVWSCVAAFGECYGPTDEIGHTLRELTVEEEYIAGTDPTNRASQLTSQIEMIDGVPNITWNPDLEEKRTYKIWGSENLTDWQCPTNALHHFFKVTVEMP